MARLPTTELPAAELPIPFAEHWFDEADVRESLSGGVRGTELLDHLAELAGARYRTALHQERHVRHSPSARDDILTTRPAVPATASPEIDAHRDWLFTGRCEFEDRDSFLATISDW
jgi:hypothetical protein